MAATETSQNRPDGSRYAPRVSWQTFRRWLGFLRRNPALTMGLVLLASLMLFSVVGAAVYDTEKADPLSVPTSRAPSAAYLLGTDQQARDMLAVMIVGTPLTLRIGILAGVIGTAVGTILAFTAGYFGGAVDTVIRTIVDIGLTIPSLVVLIIIALSIKGNMSVNEVALIVASTAWLWPTRSMRSQVLSMRERTYVQVAQLSGRSAAEIILFEMMPNLIPFIAASLVNSISQAVLASIGLEALGLGAIDTPTIGMTIYWAIYNSALLQGLWWVWIPAIVVMVVLFLGLFLVSAGLDRWANPRLRRA